LILKSEHFQIIDGLLYHLYFPRTKRLNEIKPMLHQLCVPDVLREDLFKSYHDNNAHIGRERLYETLKQNIIFLKCIPLLLNMLVHVTIVNVRNHLLIYVKPHLLHCRLWNPLAGYTSIMLGLYPRRRKGSVIYWLLSIQLHYGLKRLLVKRRPRKKQLRYCTAKLFADTVLSGVNWAIAQSLNV